MGRSEASGRMSIVKVSGRADAPSNVRSPPLRRSRRSVTRRVQRWDSDVLVTHETRRIRDHALKIQYPGIVIIEMERSWAPVLELVRQTAALVRGSCRQRVPARNLK